MEVDGGLLRGFNIGRVFTESSAPINSLDFHRSTELLVSGGDDDAIRLFDAASGAPHAALASRKYGVSHIRFTHDPSGVVYGTRKGNDAALRYHDLHANRYVRYLHGHGPGPISSLSVAPAGDGVLSASSSDGTARLWDLRSPSCEAVLRSRASAGLAACFDDQGLIFAVAEGAAGRPSGPNGAAFAEGGAIKLYNVREYGRGPFGDFAVPDVPDGLSWGEGQVSEAAPAVPHGGLPAPPPAPFVTFSRDGTRLLVLFDGAATVLDAFDGAPLTALRFAARGGRQARSAAFTPDGGHVLVGCDDRAIRAWPVHAPDATVAGARRSPAPVATLTGHAGVPLALAWSPRKALLASACTAVALWIPDPAAGRGHRGGGNVAQASVEIAVA